jgi:hypothetical protein
MLLMLGIHTPRFYFVRTTMPDRIEREKASLVKLCGKLKANSSTVKHVYLPPIFEGLEHLDGWAVQISSALLNSRIVSKISMCMSYLLHQDDVHLFLPYLRGNPSLRIVDLYELSSSPGAVDLCVQILSAIAENRNVEEIKIGLKVPVESILQCLGRLRAFSLDSGRAPPYISHELSQIGQTIKGNLSLDAITLRETCDMEPLLQGLVSHPSLRQVALNRDCACATIRPVNVLGSLIRSSSVLEKLDLTRYNFTMEVAEQVISALKANRSIVNLLLAQCMFSPSSSEAWVDFFRSSDVTIQTLCIWIPVVNVAGHAAGTHCDVIGAFLSALTCTQLRTLQLGFGHFDTDSNRSYEKFFDSLKENSSKVRLVHLHLVGVSIVAMRYLAKYLSTSSHLGELTLSGLTGNRGEKRDTIAKILLPAFHQNWGLKRTSVTLTSRNSFFGRNSFEMKWITTFCQRNTALPVLLTRSGDNLSEQAELSLAPRLFFVAQQIRGYAHNAAFMGLLALKDDVGHRVGSKCRCLN